MLAIDRGDEAEPLLMSAAATFDAEKFSSQAIEALVLLAEAHSRAGDRQGTHDAWRRAIPHAQRLDREELEADLNRRIGELGE